MCRTDVNADFRWLAELYAEQRTDAAIDILFRRVDELLTAREFEVCNDLLRCIDLNRLDTNLTVAVLSITLAAAERLPYRQQFVWRVAEHLQDIAPERAARLLEGLE